MELGCGDASLTVAYAAAHPERNFLGVERLLGRLVKLDKKGPALKKIAAKYKGKPDGQEKAIKNFTSGNKVKTSDGKEVEHTILNSKDIAVQKNLADWILSQ